MITIHCKYLKNFKNKTNLGFAKKCLRTCTQTLIKTGASRQHWRISGIVGSTMSSDYTEFLEKIKGWGIGTQTIKIPQSGVWIDYLCFSIAYFNDLR